MDVYFIKLNYCIERSTFLVVGGRELIFNKTFFYVNITRHNKPSIPSCRLESVSCSWTREALIKVI